MRSERIVIDEVLETKRAQQHALLAVRLGHEVVRGAVTVESIELTGREGFQRLPRGGLGPKATVQKTLEQ